MTDKKQILKIIDDEIKIYEEKLMIVDTAAYSKRQISIAKTALIRLQHKINEQLIGGKEMEWKQESELLSNETELLDDTSMYQGINESHHDYCIRLSKILGMATDTSEEDAIDRVEAFFKVFNDIPRVNAYSPEDIKAGLEQAEKCQNGGDLLQEDEHDNN